MPTTMSSINQSTKLRSAVLVTAGSTVLVVAAWFLFRADPQPNPPASGPVPLADLQAPAVGENAAHVLRPELAGALGLREPLPDDQRLDLLRALSNDLTESECDALLAALLERRLPSIPAGWHSEYVHEISIVLQRQRDVGERFARALATISRDTRRDEVVRDYAIQHLRQLWDRSGEREDLRTSIEATFRELVAADPVVSPSALLSLHLLGTPAGAERRITGQDKPHAGFKLADSELDPLVISILGAPPAADSVRSRMTACRVAADRRLQPCRNSLREIAASSAEHALVRMAAVNALGKIGHPDDLSELAAIKTTDPRVSHAISSALAAHPSTAR